jgi:Zn-dependent M28 family amino/carboxypeptidase
MRANPDALGKLLEGSGQDAKALLADFIAGKPLPRADLPSRIVADFALKESDFTSQNVIARLPGTDPALAGEAVVVSAHLDGYGFGEPVDGDDLYNGAFDDAAYVATLVRLADSREKAGGFKRPVIFAAFTGEEKGLLGARWFVEHPPVPLTGIAANINLDAIRPLFPLKILTLIGHGTSSLTATATDVGKGLGITVRPDFEPERGMIGRTDASAFLTAGIPAISFMFGYDGGSPEEAKFRTWYKTRYHKPQDDVTQPIDFQAAADFNRFFYTLTGTVADAAAKPVLTK